MKTDKTDNELINEFMDIKEVTQYFDSYGIKKPIYWAQNSIFRTRTHDAPGLSIKEFINESKYQTSWDWLMPVVEKIDSLDDGKYIVTIDPMITIISENGESVVNECQAFDGRIKNTYGAVVEFIKWYSSQPKP